MNENTTASAITHDPNVADILQKLIDWHGKRTGELQTIVNQKDADIVLGEKTIACDSDMAKGIRIGVAIALEGLGKLPISLQRSQPDPWDEGFQAYQDGQPMSACPYPEDVGNRVEWEGGWMAAEEEDE
jgi:ribosome modulation factor